MCFRQVFFSLWFRPWSRKARSAPLLVSTLEPLVPATLLENAWWARYDFPYRGRCKNNFIFKWASESFFQLKWASSNLRNLRKILKLIFNNYTRWTVGAINTVSQPVGWPALPAVFGPTGGSEKKRTTWEIQVVQKLISCRYWSERVDDGTEWGGKSLLCSFYERKNAQNFCCHGCLWQ